MASNLWLVYGPVLALAAARLAGPLQILPAIGIAVAGQLVGFGAYATWRHLAATGAFARRGGGGPVMVARIRPTVRGRLRVLAILVVIAVVVAAVALALQLVVSLVLGGEPSGVVRVPARV